MRIQGRNVQRMVMSFVPALLCVQLVFVQLAPSAEAAPFSATALNAYSSRLSWSLPNGAQSVRIIRNGRWIDRFPATAGTTYTDYLLWEKTTYSYRLSIYNAAGAIIRDSYAKVVTSARSGPFPRLYADWSFWNTPISGAPALDQASSTMVQTSLVDYASLAQINDDFRRRLSLHSINQLSAHPFSQFIA